ncbi:hypothetical protein EC13107_36c01470 [Escherichia coli]|nr:hypothetical protein EC13107_36c01470 [Escherichia coli]
MECFSGLHGVLPAVPDISHQQNLPVTEHPAAACSDDVQLHCVFRSIRSRIGIEVRSAIRIHSINRELNFFYRFLTRFFAAFHCRGIFPQGLSLKDHSV